MTFFHPKTSPLEDSMNKSSIFTSAAIASLLMASGTAVAQADHQIVYSYAALLDSAGNHYVPINEDMRRLQTMHSRRMDGSSSSSSMVID